MTINSPWPSSLTYRRYLLDRLLGEHRHLLRGLVVDVGGKKRNPRGNFRALESEHTRWVFVNINPETGPDLLGDAHCLPLKSQSADTVLCCEVLEHVNLAEVCFTEMLRILKPGGTMILSVPFLYPIHADPHDFGRFTPERIRSACGGPDGLQIIPMGGWLGTVGMFIELGAQKIEGRFGGRLLRGTLKRVGWLLSYLETRGVAAGSRFQSFATGYFCVLRKDASQSLGRTG